MLFYLYRADPAYRNKSGMRNSDGTFLQGHSGNPSGRPAIISELQKLARTHTPTALATLVEINRPFDCEGWTLDRIRSEGFSEEVVEALGSVTVRNGEEYFTFVRRAAANPIKRRG
jgi:hypothetical protein